MKYLYRLGADAIFLLHLILVLTVLFGWAIPSLWPIYMAALVSTLLSYLIFGYCILSKWEFDLRKKLGPKNDYDYRWTSYYTYKFTNSRLSMRFIGATAMVFVVLSILINLYFRYFFEVIY